MLTRNPAPKQLVAERARPGADLRGATGADALKNSVDLAQLCDRLGYRRYWVAEHHATPMLACASPEALIGPIAATTERIQRRQRRRDAAALFAAQGRRDLLDVRRAFPRPHRSWPRPRAGKRSEDRLRAAARPPPGRCPTIFPNSSSSCSPISRTRLPRRPSVPRAGEAAGPAACARSPTCSAPRRRAASGRRELGLPYVFADFINPQGAAIAQRYRAEFTAVRALP